MKRIISISFTLILILGSAAICFADSFSIRNGIAFGLTKEEVISIEKNNGLNEYEKNDSKYDPILYPGYDVIKYTVSSIGGIKAGLPNGQIVYCFNSSGELDVIIYEYGMILNPDHNESYTSIRDALFSKYGDPLTENENKYIFTTHTYKRFNSVHGIRGGRVFHNAQWDQKYDDNYVIIDLIEYTRSSGADVADIQVEYSRMSHEEMSEILSQGKTQEEKNERERAMDF